MTQQVLNNPEMLRQALDNPLVQSMTSNPELMRSIMMSNPEMQQLMEVCFMIFYPSTRVNCWLIFLISFSCHFHSPSYDVDDFLMQITLDGRDL